MVSLVRVSLRCYQIDNGGRALHYHRIAPFPVVKVIPFILGVKLMVLVSHQFTNYIEENRTCSENIARFEQSRRQKVKPDKLP